MVSAGSGVKQVGRTRAQAADVPLVEAGVDDADDEDADEEDDDALAFESEPDDEDDAESDDFAAADAGVLLDEEPRLSFR